MISDGTLINATLEDEKLYIKEQIQNLERSIEMLKQSNEILILQGENDPDFKMAISENKEVIQKYQNNIKELNERIKAFDNYYNQKINGNNKSCFASNATNYSQESIQEKKTEKEKENSEGIYI